MSTTARNAITEVVEKLHGIAITAGTGDWVYAPDELSLLQAANAHVTAARLAAHGAIAFGEPLPSFEVSLNGAVCTLLEDGESVIVGLDILGLKKLALYFTYDRIDFLAAQVFTDDSSVVTVTHSAVCANGRTQPHWVDLGACPSVETVLALAGRITLKRSL